MDIFKLGDKILALLEAVFGFWNNQISLVFAMLGQSPVSFKGGGPWAVIEGIEPVFVAVGSSLVVLFFVIGFCSESIDVKDEMRFESILRMLIRLGLAEWFVANNVTIMKAFFTSIGNLVGLISAGTTTQLAIDSTQADIIKGLGFGESLVMLILTALLAIIIIICGFFIIYTVYFRFLKILIIVPLGAIACSTMAGNRMVSHTMATYCKYFLSCVFEAVTMALAIVVCNAFINAGLPAFTGSYADWAQTLIYLCEMTFTIAMTVGSVKGAQTLTSKACNPITAEFREELYTNILDAYARIREPEKEETQKQEHTQEMPEFSVTVTPYEREGSNIKGLARIYFENSFIVNNVNILQGKEKIFVSMPSYKTKQVDEQGKAIYQDVCYPVTKEFREKLYDEIISEYEKAKDKSNEKARENAEKHHGNPDKDKDKEATLFR